MIAVVVVVIALSTAAVLAFSGKKALTPYTEAELAKVQFSSEPVTLGLPNSVVFQYNYANLDPDYAAIQQSWNDRLTFEVDPTGTEATGIYYYPGYFRAKLIANGKILKEHDVHIRTKGWMATLGESEVPRYFYSEELVQDGVLRLSDPAHAEIHQLEREQAPILTYHYFDESFEQIRGDDFIYEARFRNSYHKSNGICQFTELLIHGQNGVILIPFSIPGCISDLSVFAMGNSINGKSNDLSAFGTDLSKWQEVRCEVKGALSRIFLNNELIREVAITLLYG